MGKACVLAFSVYHIFRELVTPRDAPPMKTPPPFLFFPAEKRGRGMLQISNRSMTICNAPAGEKEGISLLTSGRNPVQSAVDNFLSGQIYPQIKQQNQQKRGFERPKLWITLWIMWKV